MPYLILQDMVADIVQKAYVSVLTDERRATVTCPGVTVTSLSRVLEALGMVVTPLSLSGRFHWTGHQQAVRDLIHLCDRRPELRFEQKGTMRMWHASDNDNQAYSGSSLHANALRQILQYPCQWVRSFTSLYTTSLASRDSRVVCFGQEPCVPSTVARQLGPRLTRIVGLDVAKSQVDGFLPDGGSLTPGEPVNDAIAVIGMSCSVAGAEDIDEFWDMLCSGRSQHTEVPIDRFPMETPWRDTEPQNKWYGNFIKNYDMFDHKFFKKAPREMASTDPQHRLILQLAYQALQQSGYFADLNSGKHTGCYIAIGNVEYNRNIACYPATAFSATGNLRSFVSGKVSHFFGWTGPSITVDTACSSSSVAVHQACRAILSGECNTALAGGINLFTHLEWFQNLSGASFLSPTGQCKPFDAKADGYCRGEGGGVVFLKRLSSALADGDQVLGVIASTRVYQNQNYTPITVPNAESLSDLFVDVVQRAGLQPPSISVVEAHGTGTPVGDPAEYDGIRRVFGGPRRTDKLYLSSVKGHVGHTEHASGIISLIKVLMMIGRGLIPPQASFTSINPALGMVDEDNITIPTKPMPWNVAFRAALINNYGASGSNASMVITQPPKVGCGPSQSPSGSSTAGALPFWFCGFDERALRAYVPKFREYLRQRTGSAEGLDARSLSYQLCYQSNRGLTTALILDARSTEELNQQLEAIEKNNDASFPISKLPAARPVILCFGGQISNVIGLDKDIYDQFAIFRHYLNQCNSISMSYGLGSIFPDIFSRTPIQDIVKLQTLLFSLQYSCASTWIACGIKVATVVGHSFGELTALCISGAYSLADAMKLVSQRSRAVQEYWGKDGGSMIAVLEADRAQVDSLLASARLVPGYDQSVSIACYNGPTSFTLAGSTPAIQIVSDVAAREPTFSRLRLKKLNVAHAYHSSLVDPLISQLECIGQDIPLCRPSIPVEMATEKTPPADLAPDFAARHMRGPVFFNHAVQRIKHRYPEAIWLEAGSNSTVTTMARRALGNPSSSYFQQVNLTSPDSSQFLVESTMNLWREGLQVTFWGHHAEESCHFTPLLLPPYQFESVRHWMDYKVLPRNDVPVEPPKQMPEEPQELTSLVKQDDIESLSARLRVNMDFEPFQRAVASHIMAKTAAVVPGMVQFQIALDALNRIHPEFARQGFNVELLRTSYHRPLTLNSLVELFIDVAAQNDDGLVWEWKLGGITSAGVTGEYTSGTAVFLPKGNPDAKDNFESLARLSRRERESNLLRDHPTAEILQGRNIYRAYEQVTDYKTLFRGLDKIVGTRTESAGRLLKVYDKRTWLDPVLTECFCQVSTIYVNLMTDMLDVPENDIFVCDKIDRWARNPNFGSDSVPSSQWEIFAVHHAISKTQYISDVFAFDACDGSLFEAILGITYKRVSLEEFKQDISSSIVFETEPDPGSVAPRESPSQPSSIQFTPSTESVIPNDGEENSAISGTEAKSSSPGISETVCEIVCNLSGLETTDIEPTSDLVDLGIDSLMAMELVREVDNVFHCVLQNEVLMALTDFQSLVLCIETALGLETGQIDLPQELSISNTPLTTGNNTNDIGSDEQVPRADSAKERNRPGGLAVGEVWQEVKWATDDFIIRGLLGTYSSKVVPRSTAICIIYILNAFEELGCPIKTAKPGQVLKRVPHPPRHQRFVDLIYNLLETEARLITVQGASSIRTDVPAPSEDPESLLKKLISDEPVHAAEHRLLQMIGPRFANCLIGKEDCLQLMFGTPQGREIVTAMYAESPITAIWIKQLEWFLKILASKRPRDGSPLRILEMGAGTGGTTVKIVPMLAELGVPIQYTMTDISGSLVAAGRKRFKQYPFMKFEVLDIESEPDRSRLQSQHIVLATNCVHATRDLSKSLSNIKRMLYPDGILVLLEMTEKIPWVDFIFGLVEGWWLFEDDREYVLQPATYWERKLQSVGFGHVDWTEGDLPESRFQRLIIAHASGPRYDRVPRPVSKQQSSTGSAQKNSTQASPRQEMVDSIITKYKDGFTAPTRPARSSGHSHPSGQCVLVTGATGNLGAHIVAALAQRPEVSEIVCLNRLSATDATLRQQESFNARGISSNSNMMAKLHVIQADTSKPRIGLSPETFRYLVENVTYVVHSAWPMSLTRPIRGYEQQFKVFRNLLDLAREIAQWRPKPLKVGFQFVSSLAVVANYPTWTGEIVVPERLVTVDSVPEGGYAEAKMICEHLLHQTLHRYPDTFDAMAVRVAQISGSTGSGFWNPTEYIAFLVKSSQTLGVLPDLDGTLSWYPVDEVASTLCDLIMSDTTTASFIGHIDNPARQSWKEMIETLASCLGIGSTNIVPYEDWIARVRGSGASVGQNPALQLIDFFEHYFLQMSCGQLMLDTSITRGRSEKMQMMIPVGRDLVKKYIGAWKRSGFLKE